MAMDKLYKGQSVNANGNLVGTAEVDAQGNKIADVRNVQMNEKLSNSVYQIVHPETNAFQVITNTERRFVSDKEKEIWNNSWQLAAEALHYKGVWDRNGQYRMFDVVYYDGKVTENEVQHTYRGFFIWYDDRVAAGWMNAANAAARKDIYEMYDSSTHSAGGTAHPEISDDATKGWISINFSAYLAHFASGVEVLTAESGEYYLTFAGANNLDGAPGSYKKLRMDTNISFKPATNTLTIQDASGNNTIILNGSTGTITAKKFIGDMEGNAEAAEKYVQYTRDSDGNIILDGEGKRQIVGAEYIEDELLDIIARIDKITNGEGGAVLGKKLKIQKNGESLNNDGFDGKEDQTVNITFSPEEITGLLNKSDNKIADKWLPDSILGSMCFCGTFNPETGDIVVDLRPFIQAVDGDGNALFDEDGKPVYTNTRREFQIGDYLIAVGQGNVDPDDKVRHEATITPDSADTVYFTTGDWAVYSDITDDQQAEPTVWIKIDNTDAVRTVNGQIGDVKTYKGIWDAETQYFGGDIVYYEGSLYLASVDVKGAKEDGTIPDAFIIFGRVYHANDGIELDEADNWTFKHSWKGAIDGSDNLTPAPLSTVDVSETEMNDKYGHIKSTIKHTITLPDDTWRGVKVYSYDANNYQEGLKKRSYNDAIQQDLLIKGDQMVNADWMVDNAETGEGHVDFSHTTNGALGADSQVDTIVNAGDFDAGTDKKLYLGGTFSVSNVGWDKYGHVISKNTSYFTLPTDLYKHEHFTIVQDTDGISTIRAYTEAEYNALTNKGMKFFSSATDNEAHDYNATLPVLDTLAMALNGVFAATKLYQTRDGASYRAVDESVRVYEGKTHGSATDIYGSYVRNDNSIHFADIITAGVYSAIAVNSKGLAVAGGQILEFGKTDESDPTNALVIGGLFFRMHSTEDSNGA